tara:strand:- start:56 stop:274 length:219 start_codon:yes stop_codon:yes gene_type:complete
MTDELSVTAKQHGVLYMPKRINKKVSKIMDASALEKFKDTQAKNEHFERYNKETDKDIKKKMLSEAVAEGWL